MEDVGNVARMGKLRNAYKLFFGKKLKKNKKYNWPGHRWRTINVKTDK
jgi:hypothetical protein